MIEQINFPFSEKSESNPWTIFLIIGALVILGCLKYKQFDQDKTKGTASNFGYF